MAVTPQSLHAEDDHHSDFDEEISSAAGDDDDDDINTYIIEENKAASSTRLPPLLARELDHFHHLQQRIAESSYPLSDEAVVVLGRANNFLLNGLNIQQTKLTPLCNQLEALRNLLPPPTHQDDHSSSSCVITSTLDYLEQLSRKLQSLKEGLQPSASVNKCKLPKNLSQVEDDSPYNVECGDIVKVVHLKDSRFHIHVHCMKRKGLFTNLIFAIQTLGLVVEQMDVSYNKLLTLDATIAQDCGPTIGEEDVKRHLYKVIHEG